MANTTISFTLDEGEILANLNWLPLEAGDTLSFESPVGLTPPVIFFSPDLVSILKPTPPEHLTIGPGTVSPVFTVAAAQPGSYTVMVGCSQEFSPFFTDRSSSNLFFESIPPQVGSPYIPPLKSGS